MRAKGSNSTVSVTPSRGKEWQPRCWNCNQSGHLAKECPAIKQESTGISRQKSSLGAKAIQSSNIEDPLTCLLPDSESDSDGDGLKVVTVADEDSKSQKARVIVGGVPLSGIIDSGADITIMGGTAFKKMAAVAKSKKWDFKSPDKVPRNYDRQPFHIDGKIEVNIEFDGRIMKTPIYIKMDTPESLLLCTDSLE